MTSLLIRGPVAGNPLDVWRGAYVRLPSWLRRLVSRPIGLLPVGLRFGAGYQAWREQIALHRADLDLRTDHVRSARVKLLRWALNAPYYREVLQPFIGADGCISDDLNDAAWLRVPLLTKQIIRQRLPDLVVASTGTMDMVTTGGTWGKPLAFYLDRDRSIAEFAFYHDAWARAGYAEGDARCVFRGFRIHDIGRKFMEYEPALRELRCSPFHLTPETMDSYLREVRRRGIRFLHGFPSSLSILAAHVLRTGQAPFCQIEGIFPISEKSFPHQLQVMKAAFPQATFVNVYGLSEKVALAMESQAEPQQFEFDPLYGFAELLDDHNRPVTKPGRRGRIVGTGFMSVGMPFIRYDTGDIATLQQAPTAENGYVLVVRNIRPTRRQEFLVARTGALVAMTALNIHSEIYMHIHDFQLHQDEPGRAVVRVVPAAGATSRHAEAFVDEIRAKLGGTIELAVEVVDHIEESPRGKRSFIDQRLGPGVRRGVVREVLD